MGIDDEIEIISIDDDEENGEAGEIFPQQPGRTLNQIDEHTDSYLAEQFDHEMNQVQSKSVAAKQTEAAGVSLNKPTNYSLGRSSEKLPQEVPVLRKEPNQKESHKKEPPKASSQRESHAKVPSDPKNVKITELSSNLLNIASKPSQKRSDANNNGDVSTATSETTKTAYIKGIRRISTNTKPVSRLKRKATPVSPPKFQRIQRVEYLSDSDDDSGGETDQNRSNSKIRKKLNSHPRTVNKVRQQTRMQTKSPNEAQQTISLQLEKGGQGNVRKTDKNVNKIRIESAQTKSNRNVAQTAINDKVNEHSNEEFGGGKSSNQRQNIEKDQSTQFNIISSNDHDESDSSSSCCFAFPDSD